MKNNLTEIKITIVTIFALLTSHLGTLAIPLYILILSSVTDYITALFATENRGQEKSSAVGIKGIIKKIAMMLLVFVGVLLDELVKYTSQTVGINIPFNFLIACIVAVWLCANEILSILENLKDILGDDMPDFLVPLTKNIRSQISNKIKIDDEGDVKNDK